MTDLDLAAIRQRADQPVLGKSIVRALDQSILDRRALLDHIDNLEEGRGIERGMLINAVAHLEAVRELHQPRPNTISALYPTPLCSCGKEYPCATAQAVAK